MLFLWAETGAWQSRVNFSRRNSNKMCACGSIVSESNNCFCRLFTAFYFFVIFIRWLNRQIRDGIARELDASPKWRLEWVGGGDRDYLAGKAHSHVPPRVSRALRLDFLLRALSLYFLSRALIRRGCKQSHVGFVCF